MMDEQRGEDRAGPVERALGERPIGLIVKLGLVSLLVGFVMSVFGFDAGDVVHGLVTLVQDTLRDSGDVFRKLGTYIATGAAIVVPIWVLLRLLRRR